MYRYTITNEIAADLERLEELRRVLDGRGVLPRRWVGRVRRDLEAEAVAASTSMEGVPVTVEEVRRILVGDRPRAVSEEDEALVRGYRDAMALVLRRADDPDFEWSPELVRSIHDRVLAGDYSREAGRYRQKQVHLAVEYEGRLVYSPPPAEEVAELVRDVCEWMDDSGELAPPLSAALAHVRLAGIHPFVDGNGRTARILASLVMYRGGFRLPEFTSLEEWWGAHTQDYYAAFECLGTGWNADADVTPFVLAHVHTQRSQVEALSLRQATERAIWTALTDFVTEDLGGDPRMADALFDAFFGRRMTNRYYRGLADLSPVVAAQDLQRLTASGMLRSTGAGRSTAYEGTARLAAAVSRAAELFDVDEQTPLEQQRPGIVAMLAERLRGGCA
ncbi:MAG: Fic family protein [Actinomycetota bacterium]|nr:Fic family protein [Actinomycetota bacterium]